MFYMLDTHEKCVITSDIELFNKLYCSSIDPNIYKGMSIVELLRKKLETDCGLDEEVTSVWSSK